MKKGSHHFVRYKFLVIAILGMLLIIGLQVPASAQGPDKCVSGKCHPNYGKAKFVHGPVGAQVCTPCHRPHKDYTPEKHSAGSFTMAAKGKELCFICHENLKKKMTGKFIHGPVAMGDCIACHDPHQSDAKFAMKKPTTSSLCFGCHENNKTVKSFLHGPVAAGDCNVCHNPHSSDFKFQLEMAGNDLCFLCHEDRKAEFTRKSVHKPVAESCSKCHDSHNAEFKYLLTRDQNTQCLDCHQKMKDRLEAIRAAVANPGPKQNPTEHTALKKGPCTTCHTPHSSNFVHQLKKTTKEICYECHKEIGSAVLGAKYLHGPVQQDDCYACHDSHGSLYTQILKKYFPPEFYMPYETDSYAICWDCHNKDVALSEVTTTLTGFRNAGRNLHFVHVNKEKGRSCKSCHEPHAGSQPKHVRKEVPFGKGGWMLPIQFTKTTTGGNCVVGCHRELAYDRETPIEY